MKKAGVTGIDAYLHFHFKMLCWQKGERIAAAVERLIKEELEKNGSEIEEKKEDEKNVF
jgi:hypothetical protein